MQAFWISMLWVFGMFLIVGIPLYRIADALETHNRWQMQQWEMLASIRDTLRDIKTSR
jgi:hypothetical protein